MHEKQHKAFLELLEKNEDDLITRQIYADWLEESGYCEEAERQRLWPESKKWMVEFADRCKQEIHAEWRDWYPTDGEFEERLSYNDDDPLTYQELIKFGQSAYDNADRDSNGEIIDLTLFCGGHESMMDYLIAEKDNFWKHWSIITGNSLPDDFRDLTYFRCAC